jgi:hypothetical protein
MSASVHRKTLVVPVAEGAGGLLAVAERVGVDVEVNVLVVPCLVERLVLGEGVDVMVLEIPDRVVVYVVGGMVLVKVLSVAPDVDTNVKVMGSVPVGVVTKVCFPGVPPIVVVKLVTGGLLMMVTGVPSMVSTSVVGGGVKVTTDSVPPILVATVRVTGWNGAPVGVVTSTCVTGVPPTMSTAVKVMG